MLLYFTVDSSYEMLNWLLDMVEEDPEPFVKYVSLAKHIFELYALLALIVKYNLYKCFLCM